MFPIIMPFIIAEENYIDNRFERASPLSIPIGKVKFYIFVITIEYNLPAFAFIFMLGLAPPILIFNRNVANEKSNQTEKTTPPAGWLAS